MNEQLPPGPELDWLVAEKVMGWMLDDGVMVWRRPNGSGINVECWQPSADLGHCQHVIDALVKRGCYIEVGIDPNGARVRIAPENAVAWADGVDADSSTLPHAICLAALKAVEHE